MKRRELFALLAGLVVGHAQTLEVEWESEELWDQLIPLAELHRVTAALSGRIRDLHLEDRIPSDAIAFLDAVYELNQERNHALECQCLDVVRVLEEADIPAVPLKGLAYQLLGLFSERPGERMTVDIDILVPAEAAPKAQDILKSIGYQALQEHETSSHDYHNLPRLKSDPDQHGPGSIEVHFRVGGDDVDKLLPANKVLESAQTVTLAEQTVHVPKVSDLVDHAVMHSGISHGYARRRTIRLRDVMDINRLWALASSLQVSPEKLQIQQHDLALRYFGACLLLCGCDRGMVGRVHPRADRLLQQILWRQTVPERALLESSIMANAQLIRQEPARFLRKLIKGRFYNTAKSTLKSPTV